MSNRDAYRRIAPIYDRTVGRMNAGVLDAALKFHPPAEGDRVLDVGCGTGAALERYAAAGCEVAGIDLSQSMLDIAADRLGPEADLRLASGSEIPFDDASFDLVTASMVLHEIPADVRGSVVAEMSRVAGGPGTVLITDFRFGSLRGWRGPTLKAVSWAIEAVSGHFSGFRSFRAGNGVPGLAQRSRLMIEDEKIVGGGNIAIYALQDAR